VQLAFLPQDKTFPQIPVFRNFLQTTEEMVLPSLAHQPFFKRGNCTNCAVPPRICAVPFFNLCNKIFEQLQKKLSLINYFFNCGDYCLFMKVLVYESSRCIVERFFFCMTFSTKNLNFCTVPLFA